MTPDPDFCVSDISDFKCEFCDDKDTCWVRKMKIEAGVWHA